MSCSFDRLPIYENPQLSLMQLLSSFVQKKALHNLQGLQKFQPFIFLPEGNSFLNSLCTMYLNADLSLLLLICCACGLDKA